MELLFSSLSWISVPEKNIGYEFPIASFVFTEIHIQYFFSVCYRKSNELKSKTLLGVSVRSKKCRLRMQNFNEKHPHVSENVRCRCKICEGSIFKSQKSKSFITLPISITAHRKARKRLCNPANWSRACPTKLSRSA